MEIGNKVMLKEDWYELSHVKPENEGGVRKEEWCERGQIFVVQGFSKGLFGDKLVKLSLENETDILPFFFYENILDKIRDGD